MVNFLIFVHKNVYRIRFQEIKIRPLKGFEKFAFWSLERAKIPLYPYNVKTQKTHFLKTLSWADFDLLESNSRYIFLHKNQKIYHRQFFFF